MAVAVTGKLTGTDGNPLAGAVRFQLSWDCWLADNTATVIQSKPIDVACASDGTFTVQLYKNADLLPANSYYTVTEHFNPSVEAQYTIVVTGAGAIGSANVLITSSPALPAQYVTGPTGPAGPNTQLIPTAVKTGAYNAATLDFVPVDTTSGNVTVTLPAAPADKTSIGVKMVLQGGSNTVSIVTGGSDVFNRAGGPTTATLSLLSQALEFQYVAASHIWYVVGDDVPLGSLLSHANTWTAAQTLPAASVAESVVTNLTTDLAGKASLAYAEAVLSASPNFYVSSSGNDAQDGLTWGTAFATIAGALTAIGSTGGGLNTNPAHIHLGPGTFGSQGTPLATHLIQGVIGFRIIGSGRGLTFLWGPDAAPLFRFVNCAESGVDDLTYYGSTTGTGWFVTNEASFNGTAFAGGVTPTRCGGRRVTIGQFTSGPGAGGVWAAYGFRWKLGVANPGSEWLNDANNDQCQLEDPIFYRIAQPITFEHSESLFNVVSRPWFVACGGALTFYGGSATVNLPMFASSGSTGWFLDLQAPAGTSSFGSQTQATYRHRITIVGVQGESTNVGWVRSVAGAGTNGVVGTTPIVHVAFIGGELLSGGVAGASTNLIDWEASPPAGARAQLDFIGTGCRWANTGGIVYAPDPLSTVRFTNCYLRVSTFNWGGKLDFVNCFADQAITFTPISGATYSEINCRGAINSFVGGVIINSVAVGAGLPVNNPTATGTLTTPALTVTGPTASVGVASASSGGGGNWRVRDDTATLRWLTGLLGTAAAVNYTIYDVVNSATRLTIDATTGLVTIPGALTVSGTPTFPSGSIPGNAISGLVTALALLAPLASPTFTGSVTIPAQVNATDPAQKQYVDAHVTTTDPVVGSDGTVGYYPGSRWINTSSVSGSLAPALFICMSNATGAAVWRRQTPDVQVFTSSGTWTKPAWAQTVTVRGIGAGAGGGSGGSGSSVQAICGGAGGGGGGMFFGTLAAGTLSGTETVTVGVGTAGGLAATSSAGNAPAVSTGTPSAFGSKLKSGTAAGGTGGQLGTTTAGGIGGTSTVTGGAGGAAATAGGVGVAGAATGAGTGGASGGGLIITTQATSSGGAGVASLTSAYAGGTAGTTGVAGGDGTPGPANDCIPGGSGGGGGSHLTTPGHGGNGAIYGAGGGGGGATTTGVASGAGGNGANGIVVVITT